MNLKNITTAALVAASVVQGSTQTSECGIDSHDHIRAIKTIQTETASQRSTCTTNKALINVLISPVVPVDEYIQAEIPKRLEKIMEEITLDGDKKLETMVRFFVLEPKLAELLNDRQNTANISGLLSEIALGKAIDQKYEPLKQYIQDLPPAQFSVRYTTGTGPSFAGPVTGHAIVNSVRRDRNQNEKNRIIGVTIHEILHLFGANHDEMIGGKGTNGNPTFQLPGKNIMTGTGVGLQTILYGSRNSMTIPKVLNISGNEIYDVNLSSTQEYTWRQPGHKDFTSPDVYTDLQQLAQKMLNQNQEVCEHINQTTSTNEDELRNEKLQAVPSQDGSKHAILIPEKILQSTNELYMSISDAMGRVLGTKSEKTRDIIANFSMLEFQSGKLPSGNYFVTLYSKNSKYKQTVQVPVQH